MLHITEDTPADMLSGAMNLTIHLPTGKTVKMCVERSTPMMDLLVQVTTKHQLQITNHTLQPLQTAPNASYSETVLNYYPNTPIGALDTQHIRVVPKTRSLSVQKNVTPGHQPFESTFRLKVHLPRNQLYVTRVSRHVQIEEIIRKVCDEKNLDSNKYEARHPGNLDENVDKKLTLNDYMITEIYLVQKGSKNLTEAITSNDIMSLRKEEERKQMHNKTGGGVFNLIFRRGKSNTSSGSNSKTEYSMSTAHNEEPKSMQPSLAPLEIIRTPKQESQLEKPRPPQRKRRPAPKPPQIVENATTESDNQRIHPVVSDSRTSNEMGSKNDTGITICHSRHSSDSSGYHETSILSDHCNTSLQRRGRTDEGEMAGQILSRRSESTGNLTKMTVQSRSTSSLAFPGRKKKTAPPPPVPLQIPKSSIENFENPSPVDASQNLSNTSTQGTDLSLALLGSLTFNSPPSVPRRRKGPVPTPMPRNSTLSKRNNVDSTSVKSEEGEKSSSCNTETYPELNKHVDDKTMVSSHLSTTDILKSLEYLSFYDQENEIEPPEIIATQPKSLDVTKNIPDIIQIGGLVSDDMVSDQITLTSECWPSDTENKIDQEISSTTDEEKITPQIELNQQESLSSNSYEVNCGASEQNVETNVTSVEKSTENNLTIRSDDQNETPAIELQSQQNSVDTADHGLVDKLKTIHCSGSVEEENDSITSFCKMENTEHISTESHCLTHGKTLDLISETSPKSEKNFQSEEVEDANKVRQTASEREDHLLNEVNRYISYGNSPPDSGNSSDISEKSKLDDDFSNIDIPENKQYYDYEIQEWQLPSPPKGFKDCAPHEHNMNSGVNNNKIESALNSELFEKLKEIEEKENSKNVVNCDNSESDDSIVLNKLSLANLEKRRSLVYNRELSTSFRAFDCETQKENFKRVRSDLDLSDKSNQVKKDATDRRKDNSGGAQTEKMITRSTLPNFKITTYDEPKQKIKVFEDDTIRSNSDTTGKSATIDRTQSLYKSPIGKSMENLSAKESSEKYSTNPKKFYSTISVNRTASFSTSHDDWIPSKPVTRSKSHVAIGGEELMSRVQTSNMLKCNSLFDVSGLQSLEVMRTIQNKLNDSVKPIETTTEEIHELEEEKNVPEEVKETPVRKFQYSGPPSINMGTWSERRKVPVSVKEDADYKLGQGTNERTNSIPNVPLEKKNVEIRYSSFNKVLNFPKKAESENVTIKINGSEPMSGQKNNISIQVGDRTSRYHEFNTPSQNRSALNFLNKSTQRPHSIAFSSDFDISRVPVVRSVELKKPFQDIRKNTSVTHLNKENGKHLSNGSSDSSKYSSSENLSSGTYIRDSNTRSVLRTKSFLHLNPTVKGFRSFTPGSDNVQKSMTLSSTMRHSYETNQDVPFSKHNLRRTESRKINANGQNQTLTIEAMNAQNNHSIYPEECDKDNSLPSFVVPTPPQMPKVVEKKIMKRQFVPVLDPRDELLKSIRDFGGKKGLRSRKA